MKYAYFQVKNIPLIQTLLHRCACRKNGDTESDRVSVFCFLDRF
nr:MAG TPA: hypothetical protein [Caudoviricetes sp.]